MGTATIYTTNKITDTDCPICGSCRCACCKVYSITFSDWLGNSGTTTYMQFAADGCNNYTVIDGATGFDLQLVSGKWYIEFPFPNGCVGISAAADGSGCPPTDFSDWAVSYDARCDCLFCCDCPGADPDLCQDCVEPTITAVACNPCGYDQQADPSGGYTIYNGSGTMIGTGTVTDNGDGTYTLESFGSYSAIYTREAGSLALKTVISTGGSQPTWPAFIGMQFQWSDYTACILILLMSGPSDYTSAPAINNNWRHN